MDAKAIVASTDRSIEYRNVHLPDPGADDLRISTTYSGVSIGTETNLIRGTVSWGPYPICTGYQAVGTVEEVGENVSGFERGQTVYYRDNAPMKLDGGTSVTPASGTHCSMAVLDPDESHGVAPLPEGVPEQVASTFVMPAVGLNGVDKANVRMGDTVIVHGTGLIGLGVVAASTHRGAEVIAVDLLGERLEVASVLGAEHLIDSSTDDLEAEIERIVPGGADVVFEATGVADCIDPAMSLCTSHGKFVFQGDYGRNPISFDFGNAHEKHLTTYFPCNDGLEPGRRGVLRNMARGFLPWEETITHTIRSEEGPGFYDGVLRDEVDGVIGAVLEW